MRFPSSIKTRITLWYVFILTVALCFLSVISYTALSRSVNDRINAPFTFHFITVTLAEPLIDGIGSNPSYIRIANYTMTGMMVNEIKSGALGTFSTNSPFGLVSFDQKSFITPEVSGAQAVWVYGCPSENDPVALELMVVLQPVSASRDITATFANILWYTTPVTIILAGVLGLLLLRRMLRPVDIIARTAQGIDNSDLKRRIPVNGDDEMSKLSLVLNRTFDRLQQVFERERAFTADASHELRTPLTVIKGETTLALKNSRSEEDYRKTLDTISAETSQLTTLVNKLLLSARLDSGKEKLALQVIDLADFLTDSEEDMKVLCEEKAIYFSLRAPEKAEVQGDLPNLRELILNLVDNAVKYTPEHGRISVSLSSRDGYAYITVQDTGIGIAPEHIPHIFERFYRIDESINGTGLGLAICQRIAELHGGKIEVESVVGDGSTFTLFLPLQSPHDKNV